MHPGDYLLSCRRIFTEKAIFAFLACTLMLNLRFTNPVHGWIVLGYILCYCKDSQLFLPQHYRGPWIQYSPSITSYITTMCSEGYCSWAELLTSLFLLGPHFVTRGLAFGFSFDSKPHNSLPTKLATACTFQMERFQAQGVNSNIFSNRYSGDISNLRTYGGTISRSANNSTTTWYLFGRIRSVYLS